MASRGIARTDLTTLASHESFLRHKRFRWLKVGAGLSLLCVAIYLLVDVQPRHNGGSWLGYAFGTLGVLLILWLSAIGIRKRAMTPGRWSLKAWTSAHAYLGLSLAVVASLHSGFQFGWNVHTLAYALMMLVILSGLYGAWAYSLLPQALSDNREAMTKAQMIAAVQKLDRQLQTAAQPLAAEDAGIVRWSLESEPFRGGLWRRLSGRYPGCGNARALAGLRQRLASASPQEETALEPVLALLERKGAGLARIRRHMRIRALLEVWLYVHVPVTFALMAALAAHVVSVFFYW